MRLSSPRWHHRPRPPACCPCCPHVNAARLAAPGSCPPIAGTRPRWLSHCLRIGREEDVRLRNKKVVLQGQLVNIPTASKCNSSSSNWKHSQKESQKVAVLSKSVSHGIPIHLNGIFQVWNSSNAYPKDKHFPCKRCWKPFSTKHFSQLEQKKNAFSLLGSVHTPQSLATRTSFVGRICSAGFLLRQSQCAQVVALSETFPAEISPTINIHKKNNNSKWIAGK